MTTLCEASRIAGLVYIIPAELSYTICQQPKPAPKLKRPRERSSMHKYVSLFRFGFFSTIAAILTANPSAKAESYTLPGESSQPSAEEFIGNPGLVGIYYGHLPRDGDPRQKVTLVLLADPKSDAPQGYVLERIGVAKMPNARVNHQGKLEANTGPKSSSSSHLRTRFRSSARPQGLLGSRQVDASRLRKRPKSSAKWIWRPIHSGLCALWLSL